MRRSVYGGFIYKIIRKTFESKKKNVILGLNTVKFLINETERTNEKKTTKTIQTKKGDKKVLKRSR